MSVNYTKIKSRQEYKITKLCVQLAMHNLASNLQIKCYEVNFKQDCRRYVITATRADTKYMIKAEVENSDEINLEIQGKSYKLIHFSYFQELLNKIEKES